MVGWVRGDESVRAAFLRKEVSGNRLPAVQSALEATQGQIDGFFSQLPYKCHLEEVASVGD